MGMQVSFRHDFRDIKKESQTMKTLIDSMLAYFIGLVLVSLGVAAVIYTVWLRDVIM
jgi:hypothetical protein